MPFLDLDLSRRLERAEGHACAQFAATRGRLFPQTGAEWMDCDGAYAVFDGPDSPVTQCFGLGLFHELTRESLGRIEDFFFQRGASAEHEVSPFAGISTVQLLCERGYLPVELSNVMCRGLNAAEVVAPAPDPAIKIRSILPAEARPWGEISARGWAHEHPEFLPFLQNMGLISASREDAVCFLAELDGRPGAAAALCLHGGVALLAGASTVPELRRRGLQNALLAHRLHYAAGHGCDIALMAVLPGSDSQRNAERNAFRVAYTRTKWKRGLPAR